MGDSKDSTQAAQGRDTSPSAEGQPVPQTLRVGLYMPVSLDHPSQMASAHLPIPQYLLKYRRTWPLKPLVLGSKPQLSSSETLDKHFHLTSVQLRLGNTRLRAGQQEVAADLAWGAWQPGPCSASTDTPGAASARCCPPSQPATA